MGKRCKKIAASAAVVGTVHVVHQFGLGFTVEVFIRALLHSELVTTSLGLLH